MSGTDYKHVSYGAKVNISNGVIESVELGEIGQPCKGLGYEIESCCYSVPFTKDADEDRQ